MKLLLLKTSVGLIVVQGLIEEFMYEGGVSPYNDDDTFNTRQKTQRGYCELVLLEFVLYSFLSLYAFSKTITPPPSSRGHSNENESGGGGDLYAVAGNTHNHSHSINSSSSSGVGGGGGAVVTRSTSSGALLSNSKYDHGTSSNSSSGASSDDDSSCKRSRDKQSFFRFVCSVFAIWDIFGSITYTGVNEHEALLPHAV